MNAIAAIERMHRKRDEPRFLSERKSPFRCMAHMREMRYERRERRLERLKMRNERLKTCYGRAKSGSCRATNG